MTAARHVVLIGLMGAGKTTVGRECATRLARPFVDTDDLVVAGAGMPITEIFGVEGEAGFRERERAAIADACASPEPLVIACGGGAMSDPENRREVRAAGFVVWLQAPVEVLAARVGDDPGRPLLAGDPLGALRHLEARRAPAYGAAADTVVETAGLEPGAVAGAVLAAYEASDDTAGSERSRA
jgi:shikimate kinase